MVDAENEIYTKIATAFRTEYPKGTISGMYVRAPSAFPHVSVIQADSSAMVLDSSGNEITALTFEINVYSNSKNGKKSECKAIMRLIDSIMNSMNFVRIQLTPVANLEDMEIYRLTARYKGATDGMHFYRR